MHTESGAWQQFDLYFDALVRKDSRIKILLDRMRQRDPKFYTHCTRVAQVCFGLVSHLSQTGIIQRRKELVRNLFVLCGALHDIGMLLMHEELLTKYGEYANRANFIRRFHPYFGYYVLLSIHPDIADIVYFHHHTVDLNKKILNISIGAGDRIAMQFYNPLSDSSVILPMTLLTIEEKRELSFALMVAEYFVENFVDKNISLDPITFDQIVRTFPHCPNTIKALRVLFLEKPKPAPTPKPAPPSTLKPAPPSTPKPVPTPKPAPIPTPKPVPPSTPKPVPPPLPKKF